MFPILHLNTELARAISKTMYAELGNIIEARDAVKKDTQDFLYQGGWTGPAHDEFVELWEEWETQIGSVITELACLQDNLVLEVNKWEMATERFAYRSE
jgi:hypothetical protein